MKKILSIGLILLMGGLVVDSNLMAKPKKDKANNDAASSDNGKSDNVKSLEISTPAPTADQALNKAEGSGRQAGRELIKDLQDLISKLKDTFEDVLKNVQKIAGHGGNAAAGSAHMDSLSDDLTHPDHKDHPDVKVAKKGADSAKKTYDNVADMASKKIDDVNDKAANLLKTVTSAADNVADKQESAATQGKKAAASAAVAINKAALDNAADDANSN